MGWTMKDTGTGKSAGCGLRRTTWNDWRKANGSRLCSDMELWNIPRQWLPFWNSCNNQDSNGVKAECVQIEKKHTFDVDTKPMFWEGSGRVTLSYSNACLALESQNWPPHEQRLAFTAAYEVLFLSFMSCFFQTKMTEPIQLSNNPTRPNLYIPMKNRKPERKLTCLFFYLSFQSNSNITFQKGIL